MQLNSNDLGCIPAALHSALVRKLWLDLCTYEYDKLIKALATSTDILPNLYMYTIPSLLTSSVLGQAGHGLC